MSSTPKNLSRLILAAALLLLTVGWFRLRLQTFQEKLRIEREQDDRWEKEESAQRSAFEKEINGLVESGRQDENERAARDGNEVEQACGGPLEKILKDPALSIPEMVRRTALYFAPNGTLVQVRTDRFTELSVDVQFPERPSLEQITSVAAGLLGRCSAFVDSVAFKHGADPSNSALLILDKDTIVSQSDWKTAAREVIGKRLNGRY